MGTKWLRLENAHNFTEKYGIHVTIVMWCFLIVAITTKDPIEIFGVTLPIDRFFAISSFALWKFYLKELKMKVYELDKDLTGVKSQITSMGEDILLIKKKLLN